MIYQPDFVVKVGGTTDFGLIVEAKFDDEGISEAERRVKRFMWAMRCPVGLIITPERLRLYIDRITSNSEESIELLGEYESRNLLSWSLNSFTNSKDAALAFEAAVQSWLEELPFYISSNQVPSELRGALEYYVVPVLLRGTVRAGGPRESIAS